MKGDFSRIRFEANKHYTDVLDQQGRIAYDADHNEQRFIDGHRRTAQTTDVIGEYGAPMHEAGFDISIVDGQLQIGPGRYYVHGLLCENPKALNYKDQPFLLESAGTEELKQLLVELRRNPDQCLRVYLEVWQRMITALDDQCLGEPALGQADTTVRLQTVWRVVAGLFKAQAVQKKTFTHETTSSETIEHVLVTATHSKTATTQPQEDVVGPFVREPVTVEPRETECSCEAMYREQPLPHSGMFGARPADNGGDCGCQPIPAAGYTGQENQLYRVEIQRSGTLNSATFKWSRENASIVVAVLSVSGRQITVNSLGMDANLGFQVGQWVELSDDTYLFGEHPNRPGLLYQIESIGRPSLTLTMTSTVHPVNPARNARARRWEQSGPTAGADGVPLSSNWITLENGIEISFRNGRYFAGDAWTVAARSATGKIDWPPCGSDGNQFQAPHFTPVYRAPLACIHFGSKAKAAGSRAYVATEQTHDIGTFFKIDDCRRLFPSLTDLGGFVRAKALHISRINWKNDEAMTLDALIKNGLAVTFDHPPSAFLSAANFIVTLEVPVPMSSKDMQFQSGVGSEMHLWTAATWNQDGSAHQSVALATPTLARTPYILDSTVARHGKTVTWMLPTTHVSEQQLVAVDAINRMLTVWARRGVPVRVRVKLCGRVIHANTEEGKLLYLDGQAFGVDARRQVHGRERVDLRFPSGNDERASDFESWFYLYPAQSVQAVDFTYERVTVINNNGMPVITEAEPAPTSQPIVQRATITLAYAALGATVVQLAMSGDASVASVPANATVSAGETTASVDVAIRRVPDSNNQMPFTLTASLPTALNQASAQTAEFSIQPGNVFQDFSSTPSNRDVAVPAKVTIAKKKAKRASTKRRGG